MPKLTDMQQLTIAGNGAFQFSAIRPDKLGATEYTLVTIVLDISGSVESFAPHLLACLTSIVNACKHSPRADNLMIRYATFNDTRYEIHGFVPLNQIDLAKYKALKCDGSTALYDAVYDAIGATNTYAKVLFAQDFSVNAAVYIVTDGEDNHSTITPAHIAKEVEAALRSEFLDSFISVLVGVNTASASAAAYLQLFKDEAKLTQFIDIQDATPDSLARLAAFVGKSIRSQSQALGTGQAAGSLVF